MKRATDLTWSSAVAKMFAASMLLIPLLAGAVWGNPSEFPVALPNMQVNLTRLAVGAPPQASPFQVDADSTEMLILVTASRDGVGAAIKIPDGSLLPPEDVVSAGGTFQKLIGGDENGGLLMMLGNQPGYHQFFTLPTQGAGDYSIQLEPPPEGDCAVAVITTVVLDGSVRATFFAADQVVPLGSSVALHAAVFDGSVPVAGATAPVFLESPSGDEAHFQLLDNGSSADYEFGDGLYSALYTPSESGTHRVSTTLCGVTHEGVPFTRKLGTTFRVVDVCANLSGGVFDLGADDDGDGLFDRLAVEADVTVTADARLSLLVTLETPTGKFMTAHGAADLPAGSGFVSASIDASTLWDHAEDGPYLIQAVRLFCHGAEGAVPVDRDLTLFQETAPYLLAQFKRPPIRLLGLVGEQTLDLELDGDQDVLSVELGLETASAGEYSFAARLVSPCGSELTQASGSAMLEGSPESNIIALDFDGASIGSSGQDGPFRVVGLGVWGNGASFYRGYVGDTQFHLASEFDSYALPGDCNVNGVPDACEIASSAGPDCNGNGMPDECDVSAGTSSDCNGNTVPDLCDIAMAREEDTNENGVPDGCEVNPPLPAPYPHDRPKNRYISFDPNKPANDGFQVAFRVTLRSLLLGSCDGNGAPCRVDTGGENEPGDADCNACSIVGNPCFEASWDCDPVPKQECIPTGQSCVNDRTLSGHSSVGMTWWVGSERPAANNDVHLLVSEPFRKISTDWPEVVHVGDCEIVPIATFGVAAVDTSAGVISAELAVKTIGRPDASASWWADVVGPLTRHCSGDLREPLCGGPDDPACGGGQACSLVWGPPDGSLNFDDIVAILAVMAPNPKSTPAHMTWVDLHGNGSGLPGSEKFDPPNYVANLSDVAFALRAFAGLPYPFYDPGDCPDVATWP